MWAYQWLAENIYFIAHLAALYTVWFKMQVLNLQLWF